MFEVHRGDVLEVTRRYPDNHFDGLFCDPPYGLSFMGKGWDTFSTSQNKALGGQSPANRASKVFPRRGKPIRGWCEADHKAIHNFQAFMTEWAKEALRVLKPGAWGLVFGGTRTWHRLACALEDAGFEMRDTVLDLYGGMPILCWIYGSGFPKSYDISKGIDKAAGVERKIGGKVMGMTPEQPHGAGTFRDDNWIPEAKYINSTVPATPEAQAWQGYGTALKPSWEPVLLIRKPLDGNNVQNALKYGCGGLNIAGGKINYRSDVDKNSATPQGKCTGRSGRLAGKNQGGGKRDEFERPQQQGRWPANLILDEESAAMLDAQNPCTSQTGNRKDKNRFQQSPQCTPFTRGVTAPEYLDSGGASRFFYCAKSSPTERNAGAMELYWRKDKTRDSGHIQITREEWEQLGEEEERIYKETGKRVSLRARANIHTTVKPLDLCRYLATLILPPAREGDPRRLSVPFCGSGSEIIGALQAGWDEVDGIDIEADYLKIADARLKYWIARLKELASQGRLM